MTYPPSKSECQNLFEELKQLELGTNHEYNERKYTIIHDLAEAHFFEARSYFMAGLDNPDPDFRWACISALATHWQDTDPNLIAKLLELGKSDPDNQVRIICTDSLGRLKVQDALTSLKEIVENDASDLYHRQTAYEAILRIMNYPAEAFPSWPANFDMKLIDSNVLRKIPPNSALKPN